MKTRLLSLSLLLALFAFTGCDSNNDDPTDREVFVGTWSVVAINNNAGTSNAQNVWPTLQATTVNDFVLTFRDNNTYRIFVDYKQGTDLIIDGATNSAFTWSISETSNPRTITMQVPLGSGTVPATATYEVTSDNQATLTVPSAVMNAIFQSTIYQGNVAISIQKQS